MASGRWSARGGADVGSHLRLVAPNEVDETLAVDTARRHATMKSLTWKQYVQHLDFFLGLQLEPGVTAGGYR